MYIPKHTLSLSSKLNNMNDELVQLIYEHRQRERQELKDRLNDLQEWCDDTDKKIVHLFKQINILSVTDVVENLKWDDLNIRTCPYPKIRKEKGFYYKYDINIPWYRRREDKGQNHFRVHIHGHNVKDVDINCFNYREEMVNKMKETCIKKLNKLI